MSFHPQDFIRQKRDNYPLAEADIRSFILAVVTQQGISEAQIAAFLMATFHNGLSSEELAALTQAMRYSGETFDATSLRTFTIDKHSTGGVGDKTSLLIAPILAAAGFAHPTPEGVPGICVPMISGRSLGHTGGTLDKLETIPGFNTQLSMPQFEAVLRESGAALIGQTPTLVPADRILYALRDHTSTVESPYLITASIMSKKLAESLNALVLDVKTGSGAFLRDPEEARLLARLMVETGEAAGTRTVALLTNHSQPIGRFAGNWLEVRECVDILQGHRHPLSTDLIELTSLLTGWMLHLAGHADSPEAGATLSDEILRSGAAYQAWLKIVAAQSGETRIFENPAAFHHPRASTTLHADTTGYLAAIDTVQAGWAVQRLGAGRTKPGGPVSAHAGIEVHAKLGDQVIVGQPLVTLYAEDEALLDEPLALLCAAYTITDAKPEPQPHLLEVISKEDCPAVRAC
jgi:pyrimidine-nucleoside phosphorylase